MWSKAKLGILSRQDAVGNIDTGTIITSSALPNFIQDTVRGIAGEVYMQAGIASTTEVVTIDLTKVGGYIIEIGDYVEAIVNITPDANFIPTPIFGGGQMGDALFGYSRSNGSRRLQILDDSATIYQLIAVSSFDSVYSKLKYERTTDTNFDIYIDDVFEGSVTVGAGTVYTITSINERQSAFGNFRAQQTTIFTEGVAKIWNYNETGNNPTVSTETY